MSVITIANAKGGTAKTTTAVFLAAAAAREGYSVRVVDLDPQGSVAEWADGAAAEGAPLPFEVELMRGDQLAGAEWQEDVVILDTPPGLADVLDKSFDISDYVIVVTTPEPASTRQAWKLVQVVSNLNHAVLFANGETGRKLLSETRQAFQDAGINVFEGFIPRREAIKRCNGLPLPDAPDLFGYSDIWAQITGTKTSEEE